METILVKVSVLSTLAIVAIVLSVVVILQKLKGKVDVEVINDVIKECDINNDELERGIISRSEETNSRINKLEDTIYREIEEVNRDKYKVYVKGAEIDKGEGRKVRYPIAPSNLIVITLNLDDKKRKEALNRNVKETTHM